VEQASSARGLESRFNTGIATCWLSLLSLPFGLAASAEARVPGRGTRMGSIVVLCAGLAGLAKAGYGVYRFIRSFRRLATPERALGLLSIIPAGLAALVTTFFLFVGVLSLYNYLSM